MKEIRDHKSHVPDDLMEVALAKEDILDKLVDTASNDMKKRGANDA